MSHVPDLLNLARLHAGMQADGRAVTRVGIVSSYRPASYDCKVTFQPEGSESGWLPVLAAWVGNGWGMFSPPTPGDLVEVQFQDADHESGFVCGRFYSDGARPLSVPSGEFWLFHQTGSFLKLTNDGKLTINGNLEVDATGPTINLTATTLVQVTAPLVKIGASGQTLHALVTDAMQTLFNNHTHSDPQGGNTGVPNTTMGAGQLTTTIQGG